MKQQQQQGLWLSHEDTVSKIYPNVAVCFNYAVNWPPSPSNLLPMICSVSNQCKTNQI